MVEMPDGWVSVVKKKSFLKVNVEQQELVFCQNCKWHGRCDIEALAGRWDFWCADGERKKEKE